MMWEEQAALIFDIFLSHYVLYIIVAYKFQVSVTHIQNKMFLVLDKNSKTIA